VGNSPKRTTRIPGSEKKKPPVFGEGEEHEGKTFKGKFKKHESKQQE